MTRPSIDPCRLSGIVSNESGLPLVIDGGTGSELERRGVPVDRVAWIGAAAVTHRGTLVEVHADFIGAGANVITTNTFATHRYVLEAAGYGQDFERINALSVSAAQEARERCGIEVAIAGSMSCLPPGFDIRNYPGSKRERADYAEMADTLARLGVDLIAVEMMQDPVRGRLALEAALSTGLPVWLGMSCRLADDGSRLVGFDLVDIAFEDAVSALVEPGPQAVNIMHTPIDCIAPALALLQGMFDGPVGAYPEVGSFDTRTGRRTQAASPAALSLACRAWREAGARVLGGCCGATPGHIAAVAAMLRTKLS